MKILDNHLFLKNILKKKTIILFLLLIICCFDQSFAQNTVVQGKGKIVLEPFAYGAVKLTGGSLRRQLDEVKSYYLAIPNDDLLKGFRKRMDFPTLGALDLGGWYTRDKYHVFGQILGGLSRLYAVTGDEACRDKVNALIRGWAECIDSTGFFFYSNKPNSPHYEYEKILDGLLDVYQFTGNKKALDYVSRITDWSIKHLSRDHHYAEEWYTLTENLYRTFLITHDKKYLDFGNEWEYHSYWNALRDKNNLLQIGAHEKVHAYSHLNTLSGAAEAYLVKGITGYKTTLINGYDFFVNNQCFATGGFGPNESLLPTKEALIKALRITHSTFETQCGSWAAFKLCKYLLMLTGNGQYGDWIEKLMINGIGASIPMSADGKVMYYSDYNPQEGMKQNYAEGWSCCTGTRPEAVAEYADLIYFKDRSGIYVNTYTPSEVTWNGVTLSQSTRFPESGEVLFNITTSTPKTFAIQFRKPSWLKQTPRIFVNGQFSEITLSDGWYKIKHQWKNGDKIKLVLPMNFSISSLDAAKKYPAAITYGPVVLAVRSGNFPYPANLLESPDPWKNFIPVPGAALNYHVKDKPELLIRPYYEFKANEPYIMYIDSAMKQRIPDRELYITGTWKNAGVWKTGGHYLYTDQSGATVTTIFNGPSIKWKGYKFDDAGKFSVEIDGKQVAVVDQYGQVRETYFEKVFKGLKKGTHTIVLTVLADKNKLSKGNYVNYIGFEIPE